MKDRHEEVVGVPWWDFQLADKNPVYDRVCEFVRACWEDDFPAPSVFRETSMDVSEYQVTICRIAREEV